MKQRIRRREFLKQTAVSGVGLWVAGNGAWAQSSSPNEKLNIGMIGVGGKGADNLRSVSSENIAALCDIDEQALAKAAAKFPQAAKYHDFRELLEQKDLDAVVITTPDHTHAAAALMAIDQGLHVYCEKPLTHTVYEARLVTEAAARKKLATQMGNSGHSSENTRRVVELIRSGAIGPVREVHAWTNRPIWPQGLDRPKETPAVPDHVHWDLWLGPAPERPYHPAYHPFRWRGWWDFGTGALGDMACHIMDAAVWALNLSAPMTVEAEGPPPHPETAPKWSIVRYEFPEREEMPPVKLTWYDGGKLPPKELNDGQEWPENGSLFVGDRGRLSVGGRRLRLLPEADFAGFQMPEPTLPRSPGHHAEWIQACKTGSPTGTHFGYSGPFTEMVLLGNVAYRVGKKLEWDAASLRAINAPEADPYIQPEFRWGWSMWPRRVKLAGRR